MEDAEKVKPELEKELAGLLDVPPAEIDVILIPSGDHVVVQFIVDVPTKDTKQKCTSKDLPRELRKKINSDKLLPNQECKNIFSDFVL
jgi:hypothetical protein